MMEHQIFNIIFSIVLLPVNFYCAFWLFQEAMNLTGINDILTGIGYLENRPWQTFFDIYGIPHGMPFSFSARKIKQFLTFSAIMVS